MMTYLKLLQGLKVDLYHHLSGSTKQVSPWTSQEVKIKILKMMNRNQRKDNVIHHRKVRRFWMKRGMDQKKRISQEKYM
jgi:hypothetical protein